MQTKSHLESNNKSPINSSNNSSSNSKQSLSQCEESIWSNADSIESLLNSVQTTKQIQSSQQNSQNYSDKKTKISGGSRNNERHYDDGVIRFKRLTTKVKATEDDTSKHKNTQKGRRIAYVIKQLQTDMPVVMQACGHAMTEMFSVIGIVKDKVPGVHQMSKIIQIKEPNNDASDHTQRRYDKEMENEVGIQIVLATSLKVLKIGCNLPSGTRNQQVTDKPEYCAPEERRSMQKNFLDFQIQKGIQERLQKLHQEKLKSVSKKQTDSLSDLVDLVDQDKSKENCRSFANQPQKSLKDLKQGYSKNNVNENPEAKLKQKLQNGLQASSHNYPKGKSNQSEHSSQTTALIVNSVQAKKSVRRGQNNQKSKRQQQAPLPTQNRSNVDEDDQFEPLNNSQTKSLSSKSDQKCSDQPPISVSKGRGSRIQKFPSLPSSADENQSIDRDEDSKSSCSSHDDLCNVSIEEIQVEEQKDSGAFKMRRGAFFRRGYGRYAESDRCKVQTQSDTDPQHFESDKEQPINEKEESPKEEQSTENGSGRKQFGSGWRSQKLVKGILNQGKSYKNRKNVIKEHQATDNVDAQGRKVLLP